MNTLIETILAPVIQTSVTVSVLGRKPSLICGFDLCTLLIDIGGNKFNLCREVATGQVIDHDFVGDIMRRQILSYGGTSCEPAAPKPKRISDDCRTCGGRGWLMSDGRAVPCECNPDEESIVPAKTQFPKGRW